jgi:hypothetical protein
MKWVTVQEYAEIENIKLAAAYKRIKENRARWARKFGRLVIAIAEKKETA